MFLPKKKGDVFFPARKAADERWGVVTEELRWSRRPHYCAGVFAIVERSGG
jgi:hypothetical protein